MIKVGLLIHDSMQGGISSYCINLCRALRGEIEFHIITSKLDGRDINDNKFSAFDNTYVHPISSAGDNIPLAILNYQYALVNQLSSVIKDNQLEIIHSAGPLSDQLLRIIGIKLPYILTYHTTLLGQRRGILASGSYYKDLDISEKVTLFLYPFLKLYESLSLTKVKSLIAVSKSVRDELITHYKYPGRITVIPNGIDTDVYRQDKSKKEDKRGRIIFSGRLIAQKGPQFVIKAMPQVLNGHRDALFLFAGTGKSEPYKMKLREIGIPEKNYEFCCLNYKDMPEFYSSGDILVLPSLVESFPMAILEAMACGLPVIASNVGDVNELVKDGETGFLISKCDYRSMAERINELLDDENLRKRMGANARNFITKNYSLDLMGQRTLNVYQELLEEKK